MASYRDMHELGKDPARVRNLADRLLKLYGPQWTDWELDFLENMSTHRGPDPLSTRQCEKLVELQEETEMHSTVDHFSIASLINNCWLARLDLESDYDVAFLERAKDDGATALRRRDVMRLLHCARELGLIERYVRLDS